MTVDSPQTSAPSTRTKPACFAANTFDSQDGSITMGDAAMPQSHATNDANARPDVSAKPVRQSSPEHSLLAYAERMSRFDMCVMTGRHHTLRTMRRCIESGWMRELPELAVMADGDGFVIHPERWRIGYELTDAGRAALAKADEEERASIQAAMAKTRTAGGPR